MGGTWGLNSHGMCSFNQQKYQIEQNLLIKDTECPRYSSAGPMPNKQTNK